MKQCYCSVSILVFVELDFIFEFFQNIFCFYDNCSKSFSHFSLFLSLLLVFVVFKYIR